MTVAELIEALKAMPQDALVIVPNSDIYGFRDPDHPHIERIGAANDRGFSPYIPSDTPELIEGEPFDAVLIG